MNNIAVEQPMNKPSIEEVKQEKPATNEVEKKDGIQQNIIEAGKRFLSRHTGLFARLAK